MDDFVRIIGMDALLLEMAQIATSFYETEQGNAFYFTDECVAYEIEFHIDGYLFSQDYKGYSWSRYLGTLLWPKAEMEEHCKVVDIYVSNKDAKIGSWAWLKQQYLDIERKVMLEID